jgi:hypothetical protein
MYITRKYVKKCKIQGFHGSDYEEWHHVTPCGWFLQEPHGVTSQKTPFFMSKNVKSKDVTTY